MEHFLLKCTILQAVRYSVLDDIDTEFNIITGKTFSASLMPGESAVYMCGRVSILLIFPRFSDCILKLDILTVFCLLFILEVKLIRNLNKASLVRKHTNTINQRKDVPMRLSAQTALNFSLRKI
jgi:hypothetical protein